MSDDPYEVFGVPCGATPEQIRRAYRRLVLRHHPDRNPGDAGATARFLRISAAYQAILTDEDRVAEPANLEEEEDEEATSPRGTWPDGGPVHYPTADDVARVASGRKPPDYSKIIYRVVLLVIAVCLLYFALASLAPERLPGEPGAVGPEWYGEQNKRY